MTLEERIRSGKLYFCTAPGFAEEQERCLELLYDYNATRPAKKPNDGRSFPAFSALSAKICILSRRCTPALAKIPTGATTATPTST